MNKFYLYILTTIILTLTLPAWGTDYYVDAANGSNSNSGASWGDAWKTITYAINNVNASSSNPVTIHIAAGTYISALGENFPIYLNDTKDWISLAGVNKNTTIIDASGGSEVISFFKITNSTVEGVTLTGGWWILWSCLH